MSRKIPLFDISKPSGMKALNNFMDHIPVVKVTITADQVRSIIRQELEAFFANHNIQQPKQEVSALTIAQYRISAREELAKAALRKHEKQTKKRMAA